MYGPCARLNYPENDVECITKPAASLNSGEPGQTEQFPK